MAARVPLAFDTPVEVEERQIGEWRRMSAAETAALVAGLTDATFVLTSGGLPPSLPRRLRSRAVSPLGAAGACAEPGRGVMKRIADLIGRELRWVKGDGYELQDGDETVATLRFRSIWGSLATAESADGCWTFKRVGFFQTRATIRRCDSDEEIAVFKNNTWSGGGTLEFPDGRRMQADTNCWMTKFAFTDETGETLVRFHKIGGLIKLSSTVEILPAGVQLHNDAAAGSAATA
jgi:hypothetical protein